MVLKKLGIEDDLGWKYIVLIFSRSDHGFSVMLANPRCLHNSLYGCFLVFCSRFIL